MAKDEGKDLGYHWRRAAGVYDKPGRTSKGNASTTSDTLSGLTGAQTTDTTTKPSAKTKASPKK